MKKSSKHYTCYGMCYYDCTPFSNMVNETRDKYIIVALASDITCICSFDLWMFQVATIPLLWLLALSIVHGTHPCNYWDFWSA